MYENIKQHLNFGTVSNVPYFLVCKTSFFFFFWHVYVLGKVYPLQISLTEMRDVIAALTLALATYTHVRARNAEGKGKRQYIRQGAD